jgi:hypothetical protein
VAGTDDGRFCCCCRAQDADVVGAELLGCATIPVDSIAGGQTFDEW